MILVLVCAGFLVGASAAFLALLGGGGILLALAAYGLFGIGAVVATAFLIAVAPIWRARKPELPGRLIPR